MTDQNPPPVKYDIENQYQRITPYILAGETLEAVFDCKGGGTGFVGITDQRVIFYDQGRLVKKKSMVSIPYGRIIAVSVADEGKIFKSGELMIITAAGNFSFEFRGTDKGRWTYEYITTQILKRAR